MFAILTQSGSTYDLPVVATVNSGTAVAVHIGKRDSLSYQKNITSLWSKYELIAKGVVRFEEPRVPNDKLEEGAKVDTYDSYVVTRKATWVDNPDFVPFDPKAVLVTHIKEEAGIRILAIVPEWKQRNLTARAAMFAKQVADGTPLTTEQEAEWVAGVAMWTKVDAIRTKSDVLEESTVLMTSEEVNEFDVSLDEVWV